jgi:beta-lactam-binding protein with PASTA domain/predicted flap endonuclease-1-like 5' DNA nuclease
MAVTAVPSVDYSPGTVIEQSITTATYVPVGTPLYLKVAVDTTMLAIGSLEGRSLQEVQAILQNHRLPMIVMPQTNFDYQPGIVFEQISAPGKAVSPGLPVYLKVALDTMIVEIPSCDSLKVEEAYQTLRELHLPMVTKLQLTTVNRPGVVLKQNPPSGSRVPAGTPVYFEVAVSSDSVTVPALANRPFEDAWAVCQNIRLPLVLLEEKTGEHRPGIIVEQITPPGSQLPLGSPLYLKLALGRDEIEVPDLVGRPLEEARNITADLQLPMILLPEVTAEYDPGTIAEQNLPPGTPVPPGTPLFLKLAAAAGALKLPDLAGRDLNEVRELLQEAGLQIILTDSTTGAHPPGLILGQDPLPGSEVEAGASVVLTVAARPPQAIEPPGWMAGFSDGVKKTMPGLIVLAGLGVILLIAIVSLKTLKKRRSVKNRQPEKVKVDGEVDDPGKIDLESEVHFETFPDIGRQHLELNGPLMMPEKKPLTVETASPTPAGKPVPRDETELAEIQQLGSKMTELLQASNITTFGKLAKALKVKMRLKAVPDLGRQYLQTENSLILKETDDLTAGSETVVPETTVKSEVSVETGKIQENGREIAGVLQSSNITTFAQLTAALNFKIGLKPFPDAGKQHIRVEETLLQKDDLKRIEGIGPKISEVLRDAGIVTFTQLAAAGAQHLGKILEQAGLPFTDPATWPEQAKLAAAGDWQALDALQKKLKGGRRV